MMRYMAHDKKPRGRPTTHIDKDVLAQLRQKAGYTQLDLAAEVYRLANKRSSSHASLKNTGQRWEKRGTLDSALATHLATVLKTTVEVLRGEHPLPTPTSAPKRVEQLEALLRERSQNGTHPELQSALEYVRASGAEDPVRALAEDLNQELEIAPLSASKERWNTLAAITGMTKRQMLQPVSHDGLWLLIANGPPGPIRHELLHGVHGITHALHDEWKDLETENSQGDSVITFSEEKPWYKISWMPQRAPEWVREFRFVRCQPTESGLLWVAATDNDEFWLEQLNRDAHGYFDYVETADGLRSPTDVTKLRLLIHRHVSPREAEEQQTSSHLVLLKVHHGSLPDMHPNTLDAFSSEGCAKSIAVNRLCYGLWEALLPYLAEWPLKYWSFRVFGGCIGVALDLVPFREWSNPACPPPVGNLLSISLAELTTAGRHKSVPWSRANVKAICAELNKSLKEVRSTQVPAV